MRSLKISSLLLFAFCSVAQAQPGLNYNTVLSIVRKENPLAIRAGNFSTYSQLQMKAARGNFDPQVSSFVENKYFNSANYFTMSGAEIKQPIYTSQYIKAGYQYGQGQFVDPEKSTSAAGVPYIGFQASLLQGLMFDKNRAEVTKGKHYVDYFNAEEKIQLNDLLYITSGTYFDYLYARKVNELYAYFANLAGQRLQGITDLSLLGERPTVDTIEAAIFLQGRLLDKQAGEVELMKKHNELLVLLQSRGTLNNSLAVTDSIDLLYTSIRRNISEALLKPESDNPIIHQYAAKQKVLETEARLKKEMIKPVLDVNYNLLNNGNLTNIPGYNINNYKWGATFSLPLFLRKPRHEYKMATVMAQNNGFELANKQSQLNYKRKFILESIQITTQQISNAERSAAYSKLLVEAERVKFTNGESSLFILNARESKWLESELKLAEYKLKYIKSFAELVYVDGHLKYELPL